jgi:hypothetical protein
MADAEDLKSSGDFSSCGFDSHPGHQFFPTPPVSPILFSFAETALPLTLLGNSLFPRRLRNLLVFALDFLSFRLLRSQGLLASPPTKHLPGEPVIPCGACCGTQIQEIPTLETLLF